MTDRKASTDDVVKRLAPYASVFLRVTLGVGFFSDVLDRFGLWGVPGATNVAWGDFGRFTAYTATLTLGRRTRSSRFSPGWPRQARLCSERSCS